MSDSIYGDDLPAVQGAAVKVEESRAMAEVKAQVFMARQYPRDVVRARDRILVECQRIKLAEKAEYTFPRGGSQITGPSIRLAEVLIRAWGNAMAGIVEVERRENESAMLAYAWDLETNTMHRQEFIVPHTRDTKNGKKNLSDDRDIYEMTANQGSRRKRACILALIPGDIVDEAVAQCRKTLVAKVGDLNEVIPKMVAKFEAIGITKAQIEKRLGHRIEATQAAEVVNLGSIYNSINDGMAVATDFFPAEKAPEDIVKPAATGPAPNLEHRGPGRPPKDDMSAEDIWAKILEYGNSDKLPAPARKDIENAIAQKQNDPIILRALLNKVKAAYKE